MVVSSRGGAVLECRNLFKGRAAILADSQNGNIIVLSQITFSNRLHGSMSDLLKPRFLLRYGNK
jgi:hypothetical protein